MPTIVSVVISAAGFGSRMGMDTPKSLIKIRGCSLIEHQLSRINKIHQVIVVVGYKAELVAREVWKTRTDSIVVINHRFETTGTASSLRLGAKISSERLIGLDGDVLLSPASLDRFLHSDENLLGVSEVSSINPHMVKIENDFVTEFDTLEDSNWEWTGPVSISKSECKDLGDGHVYQGLSSLLPIKAYKIDGIELDYATDILRCEEWLGKKYGIS